MITAIFKNVYEKFSNTKKQKIIPKNVETMQNIEDDTFSSKGIFTSRFALIRGLPQIGNLIVYKKVYRNRMQSTIIYPEQEEVKEEPIELNNEKIKEYKIKVKIDVIKQNENQEIVEKYNELKPANWQPLEILQRAEGGFQIEIPDKKNVKCTNQNDKIKQLRWMNKTLVCRNSYIGFNHVELQLLFRAMHSVLGDNVYLE
jgi:hypothetical protein